MRLEEYELMYRVEDRLWWYHGMQAITRALVEKSYPRGGNLRILDAGCGTGAGLSFLADYGRATGIDVERYALRLARQRGHRRLAQSSVVALPLPTAFFDLVMCLDVLVSLDDQDEAAALREIQRVMAPGARLLLRVAAHDWLRGAHDRAWQVRRRYGRTEVRAKLGRVGLAVEHVSHANTWLFPAAVAKRMSERLLAPASDHSDVAYDFGRLNGLLGRLLASEAPLVAGRGLPFGLSLFAVARKPV